MVTAKPFPNPPPVPEHKFGQSGDKVTVGCKLPDGLRLRLFKMEETQEPVMGGGWRTVQRAVPFGPQVVLKGNAQPLGIILRHMIIGGYGITENVDKDFIDEWFKQNADSDIVKNHLIVVQPRLDLARDQAKEQSKLESGFEPINPGIDPKGRPVDPRMPREVQTWDKQTEA